MFIGTYYGITCLLNPLIVDEKACVAPMQKPLPGKPLILEICPASTLTREGKYCSYKEKSSNENSMKKRDNRKEILKYLESKGVCLASEKLRKIIIDDYEGDALDSIIAAYATFKAHPKFPMPDGPKEAYKLEGYVYV